MTDKVEKKKCAHCGKTLVPIGDKRKNGKCHIDWEKRKYHKKCLKEKELLEYYLKNFN
jgi:hypothetical protein